MECAFHPGVPAAGFCTVCQKALCSECVNLFQTPMCESCSTANNRAVERGIYIKLILSAVAFILIAIMVSSYEDTRPEVHFSIGFILFISYYIVSIFWGVKFLDRWHYTGTTTISMVPVGVLLRIFLAGIIGPLVAPVVIVKMILELRGIKQTKHALAQR